MALTFADSHNMIAYLTKSYASEGFDQIIDFLNASSIKYALIVNLNIYVSCIKQFWSSVLVKKVNDVMHLQALIDKKKVIITEATVREALRLDDAESVDCLPNEEIFTELSRTGYEKPSTKLTFYKAFFSAQWKFLIHTILQCMSAKRISWNEFSSSVASAVICLSTGMIVAQQADDVVDEVATGVDVVDVPAVDAEPTPPSPPPPTTTTPPPPAQELPSTSQVVPTPPPLPTIITFTTTITFTTYYNFHGSFQQFIGNLKLEKKKKLRVSGLKRLRKVRTAQMIESSADTVIDDPEDTSKQGEIIANIDAYEDVTLNDVATVAKEVEVEKDADVQGRPEDTARRRKRVVIRDPEETATPSTIVHSEPKSKDKGKWILVEEPKPLKKQAQIEQDEAYARELEAELNKNINWDDVIKQTESQARKNMIVYLKNMVGFKMGYFKGMSNDDIRPIFEKYFNSNVAFLEKSKEQLEEEESRALKRKTESFEEKAVKKQKYDEEVEELKKHLQIVPNDDDDIYTEATPLALKVPIVDYENYSKNDKPFYKIIRADGSHQLFLSFLSLLRNFDREYLEMLWQIVQERFAPSKPKNFSDDFLLTTLTYMFEKPDVEAQIWKNQRSVHVLAKVKSWRLLESCGVHIITFTTTQMILLVERRYPLTRFTLDQMMNNVRLEVEEEIEVSLELPRFVRQQQQEGFRPK
nr:hypothetical protein [Tanacetum cinerariifolium]